MTTGPITGANARASLLAKTALNLFKAGRAEEAARALREAIALSPQNEQVKAAFIEIQGSQDTPSTLLTLCRKLVTENNQDAGKEAQRILAVGVELATDTAKELYSTLTTLTEDQQVTEICDKLVSSLSKHSIAFRKVFKLQVEEEGLELVFKACSKRGEGSLDALVSIILDDEADVALSETDGCPPRCKSLGTLLIKNVEPKAPSTATLRALSRLGSIRPQCLKSIMDENISIRFLDMLTLRQPQDVRAPALLLLSKYLETIDTGEGEGILRRYVANKISTNSSDDLENAFSVAAAVFPIATAVAAPLFLTEGFLPSIESVVKSNNARLEQAALEMLSSACVDKACREAIVKHCVEYLEATVQGDGNGKPTAALILAKISNTKSGEDSNEGMSTKDAEKLSDQLKGMTLKGDEATKQNSIEGLAYTSLTAAVKEKLIKDKSFIKTLLKGVNGSTPPTLLYGSLTVLNNLSKYTKPLTEEQKKMAQLKGYANAQPKKDMEVDELDKEPAVTIRCRALLDAGIVPALVSTGKKISPMATYLTCNILVSLSKSQPHRGVIAQQGGVKLLIQFNNSYTSSGSKTTQEMEILQTSAHALARILISVNPNHVFGAALPMASAVSPLMYLIESVKDSGADERDLLPIFESLLALTNLASTTDSARDLIIRFGWPIIEELLLADNEMIQRADVELICNLMITPQGAAKFADGSKQAQNRLNILVALADADDLATRRAAGGALAMLTEWNQAVEAVLKRERGLEIILQMAAEETDEMTHRGVVTVRNIVYLGGDNAVKKVKDENGIEIFEDIVQRCKVDDILLPAAEVLKKLLE